MALGKALRAYFFPDSSFSTKPNGTVFSDRKTICIIRPNNSKEVSQMAQGIVRALMGFVEYPRIIPVVGDNNVIELRQRFFDVMCRHPGIDIIFSIGTSSTKIAQSVTQELNSNVPIFFTFVDERSASYLMKRGRNMTGTVAPLRDYAEQFKSFFYFTQHDRTKKVLVPCSRFIYSSGSAQVEDALNLISLLASYNLEAQLVYVTCHDDLHTRVKPLLSDVALIALPRDSTLESCADDLIAIANERRVPLFSSSLEAVEQGAAISFGTLGDEFSRKFALLAKPIMIDGVHPSNFSLVKIDNWQGVTAINREAAKQQGLKLDMGRVCADDNVVLL